MIQLGKANGAARAELARVRDAVEAKLPASGEWADVAVMVNQIECKEPGCAPIETVISLLVIGAPRKAKVFKPVAEVTEADVDAVVLELLRIGAPAS
ncbi:hypothetical protein KFE25_009444 [Diacronema lutheri]|uniref:Uncharacterized protein n=1 Tax=Diacronema lutheri TaxID=2081491 RepID=A0A8J6CKF4_DIALT|nr:hypothetical protein KFE25_009444 [Diacronema lutheri]